MTLGEMMRVAVSSRSARTAGRVSDLLRFRLGYTFEESFKVWHRVTGISRADLDALLRAADEGWDTA